MATTINLDPEAYAGCALDGETFRVQGCLVEVRTGVYGNGRLAVQLVVVRDHEAEERRNVRELASGLFEDTGRRVVAGPYGAEAHVWRVTR